MKIARRLIQSVATLTLAAVLVPATLAQVANPLADKPAPANPLAATPEANGIVPLPQAQQMPEFFKPGVRIYYEEGDSVVHNHLKWFQKNVMGGDDEKEGMNSGGVGATSLEVLSATPKEIVCNARTYLIGMGANGTNMLKEGNYNEIHGDMAKLDVYWINPEVLAKMPDYKDNAGFSTRSQITYRGQKFNVRVIHSQTNKSYASSTYDLASGLLLSASTWNEGAPVRLKNQQYGKGAMAITHKRFAGFRQTNAPWASAPAPEWARRGVTLNYSGSYGAAADALTRHALPTTQTYELTGMADNVASVELTSTRSMGINGIPISASIEPAYGSAQFGGIWIAPKTIENLPPNKVLDEDRILAQRTTFVGIRDGVATILVQTVGEDTAYHYNMQNGMMVGLDRATREGPMVSTVNIRLANAR